MQTRPVRSKCQRDRLVLDNINLVYKIAHALRNDRAVRMLGDFDDVVAIGMVGLLRAASLWDPSHCSGAKFSTYAYSSIRRCIVQATETSSVIRVPLSALHGTEETSKPGIHEHVKRALNIVPISGLDITDDTAGPHELLERSELLQLLTLLPPAHKQCLELLYGLNGCAVTNNKGAAAVLNKSTHAVATLHRQALAMLRELYDDAK